VPESWEVLSNLGARLMGLGGMPAQAIDDFILRRFAEGAVESASRWSGLSVDEVVAGLEGAIGPERIIDMLLRIGPYGDGFGRRPDGLTLAKVQGAAHGIDLGPLQPRLREIINTVSGVIELAPPTMTNDVARLRAHMAQRGGGMLLIGRRDLRCSNSFMHNLPALVKGRDRCTLQVSGRDAARIGLTDGGAARISSRVGSVVAPVEVTDDLMPGVVSLPHGWGHDVEESRLSVAKAHAGVNTNLLTDDQAYDARGRRPVRHASRRTAASAVEHRLPGGAASSALWGWIHHHRHRARRTTSSRPFVLRSVCLVAVVTSGSQAVGRVLGSCASTSSQIHACEPRCPRALAGYEATHAAMAALRPRVGARRDRR
jgi:hypothetical protein